MAAFTVIWISSSLTGHQSKSTNKEKARGKKDLQRGRATVRFMDAGLMGPQAQFPPEAGAEATAASYIAPASTNTRRTDDAVNTRHTCIHKWIHKCIHECTVCLLLHTWIKVRGTEATT